ncbi:DEAD/DEAH box helicase family protein [Mycobacterium sp. CVI_P3]|uniref:DEAD/DEAH box helicase family protein n=1 Tax=Mycobacterium pinniadriaticum TaxID=2994102 RepID=A0ABT3SRA1_9MYCO|nr:DEAD/DEAH box helicase family protein [Mycobacterium pinniadriaticum]MCX2934940.1 DEAD/DEAH box helicase family protein [Mycobacterium pinniadriaticum]MCX2941362.1 DEAD/DEAH box helicase family protein [Mycobacterium pinniadriaticum]
MSNFAFLQSIGWPEMHADCARAESYATSDPRSACFYSRRTVEHLVDYLYDVLALPIPYKNDLAAKINDPEFKSKVGVGAATKLNLIRKLGNTAVHDAQPIPPRAALDALRELHHVMLWAAFRYSTKPQAVPIKAAFDSKIVAKAAPLTRRDVAQLAAKFAARDAAHAKALAEKDELAAVQAAEIAALREAVKQAQAANQQTDDRDYNEAETRDRFIDVILAEAGWPLNEAKDREYPVTGMPNGEGKGFVDYVLWGADGLPLAIVEAKRTTKSPQIGQQQAKLYADCLEKMTGRRPVIFYTNGYEHWIWDDASGYPPREIHGFYTRDELELLIQRRITRKALVDMPIDSSIVERHYQHRAIRAIDDAFTAIQREALLVMATGSGKTRTVIALVKQLMEANWVKRVLFLADRTALVTQAANAFKAHLPDATTVNLVTEKVTDGRVYVCTYPTMMNLINDTDSDIRKFGPGYFDLVVIDEAHRSVYQKYRAIFDWFDSLLVGLTATPKDEVDHNTYRLFHLEDGVPTDAYGLDDAVKEGFLVPAIGISVGTKFLREGIRYVDRSEEEKDEWDALDWGDDVDPPDEVGAEEINRFLFNEDTVDKVLAELMSKGHRVAEGDRLGKTIIFAKNQDHAEFIAQRFDIQYPHYAGTFARVITHSTAYAQSLIDDFSVTEKAPHIAISVDMLDTGIDVPDVVNLVFFKVVRSKTKFWQMIGRGTRLRPDLFGPGQDKQNFYVFDFCGNLEFFSQDLPVSEGSSQKSLNQRLFETRLGLINAIDVAWPASGSDPGEGQGTETERGLRVDVAWSLHQTVAGMSLQNFMVRPHRRLVEQYAQWPAWTSLTSEAAGDVGEQLAGLPSAHKDDDEDAKRFDMLILRRQLAQIEGDAVAAERLREQIQNIATGLLNQTAIPSVAAQQVLLEDIGGDEWWVDVTLPMLELARRKLRGLLRFLEKAKKAAVYTDFADELSEATLVDLPGITPGTNWERFQAKARAYLSQHQDHVALQRLRRNKPLTPEDLASLEQMLIESGTGEQADIDLAKEQSHGLGLFVRSLVGLDREAAVEAFGSFLDGTRFNADQIRFINLIVTELTANGFMEPVRLYESPYTDHAPTGPDNVFAESDVDNIVAILNTVRDNAAKPTDGAA